MSDKARRVQARLLDLREAIANVHSDIGLMGKDEFLVDGKTQRAVIESLIVIGEAANTIMRLDPGLEASTPNAWQQLRDAYDMLQGQLVVAISSRALFDFEEENRVFEDGDDRAYMQLQLQRVDEPARPGVAFSLVKKLLAFNEDQPRVEVVILSRNDPVSGMRVFRSARHYGLAVQRGVFTRGEPPWRYLRPLAANLFLSTNDADVRQALAAGCPRRVSTPKARMHRPPTRTKCASPSTATPCCFRTKPNGSTRPRAWTPSRATSVNVPPRRWRRALQAAAGSPAPPAARPRRRHAVAHRPGHRAQRAGARTRHPHPDGLAD
jgi:uncharacterized protein with HEPN domain